MGLGIDIETIVGSGVEVAFSIVDSILKSAVLHIQPGAGTVPDFEGTDDGTTSYSIKGLLYQSASQKNADDSDLTNSYAVRCAVLAKLGLTETPNEADYLVIDSVRWNITRVDADPAAALYIFRLRRS